MFMICIYSLFSLVLIPVCLDSYEFICEIYMWSYDVTILWSCVVTWVMTWRFLYLFLLLDMENMGELWRIFETDVSYSSWLQDLQIIVDGPWFFMATLSMHYNC
jgi:hypothetical protein